MRLRRSLVIAVALFAVTATLRPASAAKPPTTNLLFPFLSNQAGFDTEFTISNTRKSTVPIGTDDPRRSPHRVHDLAGDRLHGFHHVVGEHQVGGGEDRG